MNALPVLVVDDVPMQRALLEIQLGALGLPTLAVGGGSEALAALAQQRFGLVLLDCMMPGLDGLDTCRLLRAREAAAGAPRTPVLALSAGRFDDEQARCLAAGMDDYLLKPLSRDALAQAVARWYRPPLRQSD